VPYAGLLFALGALIAENLGTKSRSARNESARQSVLQPRLSETTR
jgi:hypothetical protein